MNVILISPKYPPPEGARGSTFWQGGMALHVARLAHALADAGCDVHVFAYSPGLDHIVREGPVTVCRFSVADEQVHEEPRDSAERALLEQRFFARVEPILRGGHAPDVIHCHHHAAFPAAMRLRNVVGAPIVSTFHYLLSHTPGEVNDEHSASTREAETAMCRASDRVIAISEWMKASMLDSLSGDAARIAVVHHGIAFEPRRRTQRSVVAWRDRFAPQGERLVMYVGRLSPEKGVSSLLASARLVLDQERDVRYVLVGGTADTCAALAQEIERDVVLSGRVHLTGWLGERDLWDLRHAADVAVVPSSYEAFGYAALEAMAAGTPVVATNAGGLPDIILHNQTGLLVPLTTTADRREPDVPQLARAQLALLRDPRLHQRLARQGRRRARTQFSVDHMIAQTMAVYREAGVARTAYAQG